MTHFITGILVTAGREICNFRHTKFDGRWQFWQMAVRGLEVVRGKREVYNYIIYYYIYINIYIIIDFGLAFFEIDLG